MATLRSEIATLKGQIPDQAHAMADVGYHFSNLWFAGQHSNWSLAKFYFDETRSHLNWAVRIKPIRKNNAGQDLDLKTILDGIDNTLFIGVKNAIEAKDAEKFPVAYRHALDGCYSCHQAADKPFLRLQIPTQPDAHLINFDPNAK